MLEIIIPVIVATAIALKDGSGFAQLTIAILSSFQLSFQGPWEEEFVGFQASVGRRVRKKAATL